MNKSVGLSAGLAWKSEKKTRSISSIHEMGRRAIYQTIAERKAAERIQKRERSRKYREKKRSERIQSGSNVDPSTSTLGSFPSGMAVDNDRHINGIDDSK